MAEKTSVVVDTCKTPLRDNQARAQLDVLTAISHTCLRHDSKERARERRKCCFNSSLIVCLHRHCRLASHLHTASQPRGVLQLPHACKPSTSTSTSPAPTGFLPRRIFTSPLQIPLCFPSKHTLLPPAVHTSGYSSLLLASLLVLNLDCSPDSAFVPARLLIRRQWGTVTAEAL